MINPTTLNSPIARASTLTTNALSRTIAPTAPTALSTNTAIAKPATAPVNPVNDGFAQTATSPVKLNDPGVQSLISALSPTALDTAKQTDLASALNEGPASLSLDSPAFDPEPSFASPENSIAQDVQMAKDLLRQALAIDNLGDELGLPDWASQGSGGGTREILPPPGGYGW